jgi:flavin reductase (DIM6/NTAB) family NADH-FMN oxidoreductase RutF
MHFNLETDPEQVAYKLLTGLVAPRPIAWVTTTDESGRINAAPFSAYNYLCTDPPIIGIGVTNRPGHDHVPKDTARNIRRTGQFVVNVVTADLAEEMVVCAADSPAELDMVGLTTTPSEVVKVPRIAQAHAALECEEYTTMEIGRSRIILGRVVSVFIEDHFVDPAGPYVKAIDLHAIGRMNGLGSYVKTEGAFINIPRTSYAEWQMKNNLEAKSDQVSQHHQPRK